MKYVHYVEGLAIVFLFSFSQFSLYAASSVTYEAPKLNDIEQAIYEPVSVASTSDESNEREDSELETPTVAIETADNTEPEELIQLTPVTPKVESLVINSQSENQVREVPFYSQFTDITAVNWRKVGCGIASVAMIIDYYSDEAVSVDELLDEGIAAGAFLSNAGWTHQGLINLSKSFGLNGKSKDMASLNMAEAFSELETVLQKGPVMVSVHYTFDPQNPIPHLVVVNAVTDGKVFYNDPSETVGGGSISIAQFQSAWKKRYIEILPVT